MEDYFVTASYHGPPLADDSGDDWTAEPIPQAGKTYPVSEKAMAHLRAVLASQPAKPQRRREKTDVIGNLLRRQREKEAEETFRRNVCTKKKGGG
jgi:hypothetical protein